VNAAHVITHDYMMLSQPLSEVASRSACPACAPQATCCRRTLAIGGAASQGIMLMDRSERRLVMVRSLGELLPLRTYNTEYGNILCRVSKHKARLANMIEVDVTSDEARRPPHQQPTQQPTL
jgi:hypothetical protein